MWKRSLEKTTVPGAKQVFRSYDGGEMVGDVIAGADERPPGEPLLVEVMRAGERLRSDSREAIRGRAAAQLGALPDRLRRREPRAEPYPVTYSERLRALQA